MAAIAVGAALAIAAVAAGAAFAVVAITDDDRDGHRYAGHERRFDDGEAVERKSDRSERLDPDRRDGPGRDDRYHRADRNDPEDRQGRSELRDKAQRQREDRMDRFEQLKREREERMEWLKELKREREERMEWLKELERELEERWQRLDELKPEWPEPEWLERSPRDRSVRPDGYEFRPGREGLAPLFDMLEMFRDETFRDEMFRGFEGFRDRDFDRDFEGLWDREGFRSLPWPDDGPEGWSFRFGPVLPDGEGWPFGGDGWPFGRGPLPFGDRDGAFPSGDGGFWFGGPDSEGVERRFCFRGNRENIENGDVLCFSDGEELSDEQREQLQQLQELMESFRQLGLGGLLDGFFSDLPGAPGVGS